MATTAYTAGSNGAPLYVSQTNQPNHLGYGTGSNVNIIPNVTVKQLSNITTSLTFGYIQSPIPTSILSIAQQVRYVGARVSIS